MNKKNIAIIAVLAIAIAGGAFYGGMTYAKGKASSGRVAGANFQNLTAKQRQQFTQNGGFPGRGTRGGANGGFVGGEVISKDDKSVTVKLQDGGSKIIFLSESTTIGKTTDGTKDDLVVGKQVTVNGSTNNDGSVTAQNIQIRPNVPNMGQTN